MPVAIVATVVRARALHVRAMPAAAMLQRNHVLAAHVAARRRAAAHRVRKHRAIARLVGAAASRRKLVLLRPSLRWLAANVDSAKLIAIAAWVPIVPANRATAPLADVANSQVGNQFTRWAS